jgi:PAS domain S-box-containing protein
MEITHKRTARLQAGVAQFLLGIACLSLITFVSLRIGFGLQRAAFAYVILVAMIAALGRTSASVPLSIVAAACLSYFFAPPLFDLRVDDPDDIVRIATFLTTALIVTVLMSKLRASERRFRTLVDQASDGLFLLDDQLTVLDVSRQACVSLGYSREELIGMHPRYFDSGLDQASIQNLRQRILGGETVTFETRHRRKDGTSFPVEIRACQFEQGGRRLLCLVRDITERKRAEDELRASEERFRSFVDHATDGFFLLDEHQAVLDVNRQACESLGYSREEMVGMDPRDFDAGLDEASIVRIGERVTSGETVTFESIHRRKDGTVLPVEIRARQFLHGAHRFRLSLVRDITERKRVEEVLRESEAKLQRAQRIAHVGWWERDYTTGHVSLSDEVCRIFGVQPLELPQWHEQWLKLIHPDDRPRAADAAAAALLPGGPRYDVEYRVVRPDGDVRIIHSQGDVTWDKSGRPLRQFGVLQDITELRRAEQELRTSEERFRTLVQFSFDVYWESDAEHRFVRQEFDEGVGHAPWGSEIGKTRWEVPYFEPDA